MECEHYHGTEGNNICDENAKGECPKKYTFCCKGCEEQDHCNEYCGNH